MSLRKFFFYFYRGLVKYFDHEYGPSIIFFFWISPSDIGMVNVCLRRYGCDRIFIHECHYSSFYLFLFVFFFFFLFSRLLLGQNLFVTGCKYGKFVFMIRINENLCFNFC
jgi:hypothetical protein